MPSKKETKQSEILIGAHLSIENDYAAAAQRAFEIGANCLQIFSTSPRSWSRAKISEQEAAAFMAAREEYGVTPVYFHASYLINLTDEDRIGHASVASLIAELSLAPRVGVRGSIVHLGSYKEQNQEPKIKNQKYQTLISNIKKILAETPEETLLIIENAGTRKIGQTIEEIAEIIKDANSPRVRVCLDTCHLHAAGYDLSTEAKLSEFLDRFERTIGLDKLELWHANDSRDPFGSLRDRHENIGEGFIAKDVFRLLLNHPKTNRLPLIIETPGFDQNGPDKKNLDILKSLL